MVKATPRERRQERTRQEILSTALKLIVEKGADNLSLREIARRIDYSPAGLYEYFGSKEAIIDAVCSEGNERFFAMLDAIPQTLPPLEYLLELGMAYLNFARQNPEQFLFLLQNRKMEGEDLPSDFTVDALKADATFMLLYNGVQHAIDAGLIRTEENFGALEISYSVWALVHGQASLEVRHLEYLPIDFAEIDRRALATFIRGLTY